MKQSVGQKQCLKCGALFLTDLRGGAKWCFPCKAVLKRECERRSRRPRKERPYATA